MRNKKELRYSDETKSTAEAVEIEMPANYWTDGAIESVKTWAKDSNQDWLIECLNIKCDKNDKDISEIRTHLTARIWQLEQAIHSLTGKYADEINTESFNIQSLINLNFKEKQNVGN